MSPRLAPPQSRKQQLECWVLFQGAGAAQTVDGSRAGWVCRRERAWAWRGPQRWPGPQRAPPAAGAGLWAREEDEVGIWPRPQVGGSRPEPPGSRLAEAVSARWGRGERALVERTRRPSKSFSGRLGPPPGLTGLTRQRPLTACEQQSQRMCVWRGAGRGGGTRPGGQMAVGSRGGVSASGLLLRPPISTQTPCASGSL